MKVSDRLEAVIAAVKETECAADIGTDHGFVPVELVRRKRVRRALAMDVRPGPLSRAREHIALAGLEAQITLRLSDGLAGLQAGEAQCVIIAGMGGSLMLRILEDGSGLWGSVEQWVLSPHSEVEKVRKWLLLHEFCLEKESMVEEDGKFYTVMSAAGPGGRSLAETETADRVGTASADGAAAGYGPEARDGAAFGRYSPYLIRMRDPVFLSYLRAEERKLAKLAETLRGQAAQSEKAAERLRETEAALFYNQEVQHEMQGNR